MKQKKQATSESKPEMISCSRTRRDFSELRGIRSHRIAFFIVTVTGTSDAPELLQLHISNELL
jgi:hypothetical protein